MAEKHTTCVLCPQSCEITIVHEERQVERVEGAECRKGEEYATKELLFPERTIASTVLVIGGVGPLVSVRTSKPVPKERIFELMDVIRKTRIQAPVGIGDVVVNNALGLEVDVIATRTMESKKI